MPYGKKGGHSYANAKTYIRYLAASKRLAGAFGHNIDVYRHALDRGVEMRVITQKIENYEYMRLKKVAAALFSRKNLEARFVSSLDSMAISIIDDKESYFALYPKKTILMTSCYGQTMSP